MTKQTDRFNRVSMVYLILVALFDFIGLGIVVTLFPKLLLDSNIQLFTNNWSHSERLVLLGIFLAIYPLGQFIGAAILGKLSDTFGRKKLLLISLVGTWLGFSLTAVAITIQAGELIFFGRLISGFFAGNIAIAQASITDISDETTKGRNISLLQVVLGVAWVIGPPLGGLMSQSTLVSWFNYSTPFWFMSGAFAVIIVLTLFLFKETLTSPTHKSLSVFENIQQVGKIFQQNDLKIVFVSWGVFVCGWWMFEAFLPTYLLQALHYNPAHIGIFLASMGATYTIAQIFVMQRMKYYNPQRMVKYSLAISGLAVIFLVTTKVPVILHIIISFYVVSMAFAIPGIITSLSNLVAQDKQGHMMGMVSSIQALATVSMMAVGGQLVAINQNITIIGGGILLIASWLIFINHFREKKPVSLLMHTNFTREDLNTH